MIALRFRFFLLIDIFVDTSESNNGYCENIGILFGEINEQIRKPNLTDVEQVYLAFSLRP